MSTSLILSLFPHIRIFAAIGVLSNGIRSNSMSKSGLDVRSTNKMKGGVTKTDRIDGGNESQTKFLSTSALSFAVAISAICIAGIGPFLTFGLISLDTTQICSMAPAICNVLSIPTSQQIADKTSAHNTPTILLEFFNRLPYQVDIHWKDYSGEEQFWFTMEPYSYTGNISSIRGHVWSFRSSIDKQLLFEENIGHDHCGKIHIAPPEHIEALRQYCTSTGRAVIGHWPRAPLVRQVPRRSEIGSVRSFQSNYVQFESYEGRLESHVKELSVVTVSTSPYILKIDNFLSDEECDHLMEVSASKLQNNPATSNEASYAWLEHGESPVVAMITKRIFDLMGFDADIETFYFAEKIQVSKFGAQQEYLPHYDALDFTTSQFSLPHNRYASVMIYLNSLTEGDGGEDVWPRANGADEFARAPCDAEYRIRPKKGSLIVMYNLFSDGVIDESSLHGSCPISTPDSEKWTANMFFWDPFVQWPQEQIFDPIN